MLQKILLGAVLVGLTSSISVANARQQDSNAQTPPPLMLKEDRDSEIRDVAAYQLKRRFMPVAEQSGTDIKNAVIKQSEFINSPLSAPEQQNRTVTINPAIAGQKTTVFASANFITTIVFVDAYGNPWDIADIAIGAGSSFGYKVINSYTVWVWPTKRYKKSNIAFLLDGLVTPVVLDLEENPNKVDYSLQMKVLKAGANTEINEFSYNPIHSEISNNGLIKDKAILSMSDGITHPDTNPLSVLINGYPANDILAWDYNGSYYIRLRGEVISPEPKPAGHPNIDGLQLFKIQRISSLFIEKDGILTGVMLKKISK